MLMMMRSDKNLIKSPYLNFNYSRWTSVTIPIINPIIAPIIPTTTSTTSSTSQFTATELDFIKNINKNYQFTIGYTAGESDAGVKYLQYILKAQKYYTESINGTNTKATMEALFKWQSDNNIITNKDDPAAGYLWPKTREMLNPSLKTLLNP